MNLKVRNPKYEDYFQGSSENKEKMEVKNSKECDDNKSKEEKTSNENDKKICTIQLVIMKIQVMKKLKKIE